VSTNNAVEPTPLPGTTDTPPTPVRTKYNDQADVFLAAIEQLTAQFPVKLRTRHRTTAGLVASRASVPFAALSAGVTALEQSEDLRGIKRFASDVARDKLQLIDAFRGVVSGFARFTAAMNFTLRSLQAEVASEVLQVYGVAKTLGRDPEAADVQTHADNIKRALGPRGRKSKKAVEKQPDTPPSGSAPAPSANAPVPVK
jgi:hypothetical protein